jgi:hypothetical protein
LININRDINLLLSENKNNKDKEDEKDNFGANHSL